MKSTTETILMIGGIVLLNMVMFNIFVVNAYNHKPFTPQDSSDQSLSEYIWRINIWGLIFLLLPTLAIVSQSYPKISKNPSTPPSKKKAKTNTG